MADDDMKVSQQIEKEISKEVSDDDLPSSFDQEPSSSKSNLLMR